MDNLKNTEKENIIELMKSFDFGKPFNVEVIFEDSDEDKDIEADISLTTIKQEKPISVEDTKDKTIEDIQKDHVENETFQSVGSVKDFEKSKNLSDNAAATQPRLIMDIDAIINKAIQSAILNKETESGNSIKRKINEETMCVSKINKVSSIENNDQTKENHLYRHATATAPTTTGENTYISVENLLKPVSQYMISILDVYNQTQYKLSQPLPEKEMTKYRSQFHLVKDHFFNLSFCTVENVILPHMHNKDFVSNFLKNTIQVAQSRNRSYSENYVKPLFDELIEWSRRKQSIMRKMPEDQNVTCVQNLNQNKQLNSAPASTNLSETNSQHAPVMSSLDASKISRNDNVISDQSNNTSQRSSTHKDGKEAEHVLFSYGPASRRVSITIQQPLLQTDINSGSNKDITAENPSQNYNNSQSGSKLVQLLQENNTNCGERQSNGQNIAARLQCNVKYTNTNNDSHNYINQSGQVNQTAPVVISPAYTNVVRPTTWPNHNSNNVGPQQNLNYEMSREFPNQPLSSNWQSQITRSNIQQHNTRITLNQQGYPVTPPSQSHMNYLQQKAPPNQQNAQTSSPLYTSNQTMAANCNRQNFIHNNNPQSLLGVRVHNLPFPHEHQGTETMRYLRAARLPHQTSIVSHHNQGLLYNNNTHNPLLTQMPTAPPPYPNCQNEITLQPYENAAPAQQLVNTPQELRNGEMMRSMSTDSGFASPVYFNATNDLATNKEDEPEPSATPVICDITSLHPAAVFNSEGPCHVCGGLTKKKCLGCYKHYYCSYICQNSDWNNHMLECKKENLKLR